MPGTALRCIQPRLHAAATRTPVSGTASRIVIRGREGGRGGFGGLSLKCKECDGRLIVIETEEKG